MCLETNTVVQVFGIFAVTATAAGSLYLMDANKVASKSGLDAVGVLLLILNMAYLMAAAAAITLATADTVRVFIKKHCHTLIVLARGNPGVHALRQKALGLSGRS